MRWCPATCASLIATNPGRRHVTVMPENGLGAAGQRVGHEAQFQKRLHTDALKEVVKLVNMLPGIFRFSPITIDTHVVVEQAVHRDVLKAALAVCEVKLPLPVGAQALVRAARADAEFEHGIQ